MSDSFDTSGLIILQPGSEAVPYSFTFTASSSTTANNGSIPYDSTISSVVAKAFDTSGNDVSSEIIEGNASVGDLVVSVSLNYPSVTGEGVYSLEFVLTLSTGAKMEFDFTRILAQDISA